MAEISQDEGGGGGKKRAKKMSTKVDMTPMVDLAFLLITFFMLTTTLGQPNTMELNMPDKTEDNQTTEVKESKVLTLILAEDDKIYHYAGLEEPNVELSDFSRNGIRTVIMERQKQVKDLIILIKATEEARFKNMVDILDEMDITEAKKFAVVDITDEDQQLIEKFSNPDVILNSN